MTTTRSKGRLVIPLLGNDTFRNIETAAKAAKPDGTLDPIVVIFETTSGTWYLKRLDKVLSFENSHQMLIRGAGSFDVHEDALEDVTIELEVRALTREGTITFA